MNYKTKHLTRISQMTLQISIVTLMLFVTSGVFCQDILKPIPREKKRRAVPFHCNEKITLDGKLSEESWSHCSVQTNFKVSYPEEGKEPAYPTEVKIMYDDVNLYIGAKCYYGGRKKDLQVQDMARDFSYSENELFNIMLDPFSDTRMPVMSLSVSPYNTQTDIMHYPDGSYDYQWNALWRSKCSIEDSFWIAEIAIPFSSLRYPADATTWRINFTRNNRATGELSGWSLWPLAYSASRLEYGGLLVNVHPPKPKLNLRLQPYTLLKTASAKNLKMQAGGDLKWAVNTNTVIDATVNTDFAQAEVDRQVINLSRSSVFFPEKRQFFLENANLFSLGKKGIIQPFFSRRIGISDEGRILPIDAGFRLVSQNKRQSSGILMMKEGSDSANSSSWFNVFRYKRNVGNQLEMGAMEVLRYNEKNDSAGSSINPVTSLDFFWRMSERMYLRSMISYSIDSRTHSKGSASLLEWNFSNNLLTASVLETVVSNGYSADAGFVAREDFINTQPSIQWNIHKKWFPHSLQFFTPFLSADIYHAASSGQFQEATISASPVSFIFDDLSQFSFTIDASWQNLIEDFSPLQHIVVSKGNYHYNRYTLSVQTNQAAHYSATASISTGGYYNGSLNNYDISFRASPIPNVAITINYSRDDFKNLGKLKSNTRTELLAPEALFALNDKIQLSGIYQYNTETKLSAVNARFSWQYRPLSFIYFVYNSMHYVDNRMMPLAADQQNAILKISYVRQI